MRRVEKPEALELLAQYRRGLETTGCVLCSLCGPLGRAYAVADNAHGVVVLNRFAQRPGHLMVVARDHVEHVHELSWWQYASLQQLAYAASQSLRQVLHPARIFTAVLGCANPIATSYPHLHIHVLPVPETDDRARPARVFSWSEGIYVYEDAEARTLAQALRAAWPAADPDAPDRALGLELKAR